MPNPEQTFSWYEITKDIIIPLLGIVSTLVIGIIIALIIKDKDQKAKVKELLIDHYLDYLNFRENAFKNDLFSIMKQILREIKLDSDTFFKNNANWYLHIEIFDERINEINKKLDQLENKNSNWSIYTFRFAFLLGKKRYFKDALPLENLITKEFLSNEMITKLKLEILDNIFAKKKIMVDLNTRDSDKISRALSEIEKLIITKFNNYQLRIFNPYNNKIAELINSY